jgi:hypothetical protein
VVLKGVSANGVQTSTFLPSSNSSAATAEILCRKEPRVRAQQLRGSAAPRGRITAYPCPLPQHPNGRQTGDSGNADQRAALGEGSMQVVKTKGEVGSDGRLRLDVPVRASRRDLSRVNGHLARPMHGIAVIERVRQPVDGRAWRPTDRFLQSVRREKACRFRCWPTSVMQSSVVSHQSSAIRKTMKEPKANRRGQPAGR